MQTVRSVFFGKYCQNSRIPEPIEWIVLQKTDRELLLLSRYCLEIISYAGYDCYGKYNGGIRHLLWEYSYLREWLNGTFYRDAFSAREKRLIRTTLIQSIVNKEGLPEDFENKVFILSRQEAETFLTTPELRRGNLTRHARNDPETSSLDDVPWWILPEVDMSAGICSMEAICHGKEVTEEASFFPYPQAVCAQGPHYHSRNIYHRDWTVRPAIRIRRTGRLLPAPIKL